MDFNLKSDLQETCLTLIVNSTVCLGRLAGLYPTSSCQSASWTARAGSMTKWYKIQR